MLQHTQNIDKPCAISDWFLCMCPLHVDHSVMARQPVSHRRLSPSSVLIYAALNRQSSGRGSRANCFDRLPLPATFEVADDCLVYIAIVTRLFFSGPTNSLIFCSYSSSIERIQQKKMEKTREDQREAALENGSSVLLLLIIAAISH